MQKHRSEVLHFLPSSEDGLVNERKLSAPLMLLALARGRIDASCRPDPEYPEGVVRSVYFDSPRFDSYEEKANGDFLKAKMRIRWYGGAGEDGDAPVPVFIESKARIGAARRKFRIRASAPGAWLSSTPLSSREWLDFARAAVSRSPASDDGELPPVLANVAWTPTIRISYSRRRYVCPYTGSRVSIDWDIVADRVNSAAMPCADAFARIDSVVCEYKTADAAAEPPPWIEQLYAAGFRQAGFSKYGAAMRMLLADAR